ncbi:MAG: hypothetical protein AAGA53_02685 [Pseudomonadota bacterium]
MHRIKTSLTAAFVVLVSSSTTALGQSVTVDEVMRALQNEMAEVEGTLTFSASDISPDGDVTINGFDLYIGAVKQRIVFDELVIDNVRKDTSGRIVYDGYVAKGVKQTFSNSGGNNGTIFSDQIVAEGITVTTNSADQNPLWNLDIPSVKYNNATFAVKVPEGSAEFSMPVMRFSGVSQKGVKSASLEGAEINNLSGELVLENGQGKFPLNVENLSISNFKQFGGEGYEIGEIKWGKTTAEFPNPDGRTQVLFDGFVAKNIYAPDLSDPNSKLVTDKKTEVTIGALETLINGKPVFNWVGGGGFNQLDPATGVLQGSGSLNKMMIDFSAIPVPPSGQNNLATLRNLGYEQITMNILAGGKWDLDTGTLEISEYDIEVENAGSIKMDARIAGYTEDVARNIQKLANEVNAETDPQAQQIKSMQMLAALTTLSVQSLRLSVEDQTLLNKVVNYQAGLLNQEPEQITQIVGPMAQVMLAPYNVPEFAASVTQALNTFMEGNKTITVTAEPEGGLVLTEIIALSSGVQAGQISPAEIIQRLNLKVETK